MVAGVEQKVPAGHKLLVVDFVGQYCPGEHAILALVFGQKYLGKVADKISKKIGKRPSFGRERVETSRQSATKLQSYPASQSWGFCEPVGQYSPVLHCVCVAEVMQKNPSAHSVAALESVGQNSLEPTTDVVLHLFLRIIHGLHR